MERLRQQGVTLDVRAVFGSPSLAGLAAAGRPATALEVPPNLIPAAASRKTTMTI
jgi:hypothetical protein